MKNCNIILNYKKKFIIPFPKVKNIMIRLGLIGLGKMGKTFLNETKN